MSKAPPRLLLVDPQPQAALQLAATLQQEGFEVTTCHDTPTATALLESDGSPPAAPAEPAAGTATSTDRPRPFQLLLLDCGLPAVGLAELCRLVRRKATPLPVLVLCLGADEAERVRLLDIGADDVLVRPFGMAECVARCRALLRRQQLQMPPATVLRCGPIEMVVEEHLVRRQGVEVPLSPKEFRLLQFFLSHPRRVWHRDELLARVWGEVEAFERDPKTVDVHIRWLRLKLERDPANPELITTVRGKGYRCG